MNKTGQITVTYLIAALIFSILTLVSCDEDQDKNYESPDGYNLMEPHILKLPIELDEISGLAFHAEDTSVFAINDERGWLYKLFPNRPNEIGKWKFYDGTDYEDMALIDSTFYVLVSNGDIVSFRFLSSDSLYFDKHEFPEKSGNEFEILYYDKSIDKLVLMCKDCESDKKKSLSTYTFDYRTGQYGSSTFKVNVKNIAKMLNEKSMKFKPSAAAINPVTGELFIVSSINKVLVVADPKGEVKKVYKLHKKFYKQPEGIAFTPKGDLLISNEAADIGVANILIYPYNKTVK